MKKQAFLVIKTVVSRKILTSESHKITFKNFAFFVNKCKIFFIFWIPMLLYLPQAWAQFIVNGDAQQTSENCYRLTSDNLTKVGSIWNATKINLNESFEVILEVKLGCRDANGADGLVFGFQPVGTSVGRSGEGMGFGGVSPSLGFEMDTWSNPSQADPVFDHVAIIKNGIVNHSSSNNLAGPVPFGIDSTNQPINIEDCKFHDFRITWQADSQKLQIYLDCKSILSYKGNIVRDIFNNNPLVFWGFTAATGGATNEHSVCLKYTSFLDKLPDTTICKGGQVQLNARGGTSYLWSPADGLSNPRIANPIAKPTRTTIYSVIVSDGCQREVRDSLTVKIGGEPFTLELGRDTFLCDNQAIRLSAIVPRASYIWHDGSTDSVFVGKKSGTWGVTVSREGCRVTDSLKVRAIKNPVANFPNDTALCFGKDIVLNPTFSEGKIRWSDGSTLPTLRVSKSGNYGVVVSNVCSELTKNVNIGFVDCEKIYIPNAISPNGDNINDVFYIQDDGQNSITQILKLEIFSRWGNRVFSVQNLLPNDPTFGWSPAPSIPVGVYTFYTEVLFKNGEKRLKSGDFLIVR
jgi:hypothetical protein